MLKNVNLSLYNRNSNPARLQCEVFLGRTAHFGRSHVSWDFGCDWLVKSKHLDLDASLQSVKTRVGNQNSVPTLNRIRYILYIYNFSSVHQLCDNSLFKNYTELHICKLSKSIWRENGNGGTLTVARLQWCQGDLNIKLPVPLFALAPSGFQNKT